jgi:DNA-directed RNA polymerase beta' subunit
MNTIKEIDTITFGIYSPDEIRDMSVCEVYHTKKTGHGSVYDPRMGSSSTSVICETCNEDASWCPGHFGHINLHEPIIHPLYYRNVVNLLSCVCVRCFRLMVTPEQLEIDGITKMKGSDRFAKIVEKIKKIGVCCHTDCGAEKPKLKLSTTDHTILMTHEANKKTNSITMTTDEIHKILDNVTDADVRLLGFDPALAHPRNYIMSVLPVLPPVDRPYVQMNGNIYDDDITVQYFEIIKANEQIKQANINELELTDVKRIKAVASLIFRISTTFNNSHCKAKHTTNARPIKGIKERLTGKEGQIRNNMMGKRSNHTARTVIGPDPTLKSGQIAVPEEMANVLTVPVKVMKSNMEQLQNYVNNGLVQTIVKDDHKKTCINIKRFRIGTRLIAGDIIHRNGTTINVDDLTHRVMTGDSIERGGKKLENVIVSDRDYPLEIGMVVNRRLQDGDIVLLNRQPTLHKGSMLAMEVLIRKHRTIRMNLAICKSFNADFDGDEMNLHIPQGLESQAELKYLSAAKHNIISPQSSKPSMAIVQDSLLGAYRMTKDNKPITKGEFFTVSMSMELKHDIMKRIQNIRHVLKSKGKKVQCFTGKGLISLFLPTDLNFEFKNNASVDEPIVKIYNGVLYEGVFDKSILGSAHSSLIHLLNKEYGPDEAMYFIDCIQFCTSQWLLIRGFTVGLGDCLVTDKGKDQEIRDVVKKCYIEADGIATTTTHPGVREIRVNGSLNKAKDVGLKLAKDSLDINNNFLSTVISGSKGDFFNVTQITGLLGQQNLKGQRVPLTMNHGRRSLPHYPFSDLSLESEFESRGFIANSFIHGLNPREFYFHAMSGREGITDTAMGTATSGYMQRRIVKLTEDIKIQYDGTVRDATGKIYQMTYGDNGIDPTMTTRVNGTQEACDIGRLVDKLNAKHEKINQITRD